MTHYTIPSKRCTHRHRTIAGATKCAHKLGIAITEVYRYDGPGKPTVGYNLL